MKLKRMLSVSGGLMLLVLLVLSPNVVAAGTSLLLTIDGWVVGACDGNDAPVTIRYQVDSTGSASPATVTYNVDSGALTGTATIIQGSGWIHEGRDKNTAALDFT